MSKIVHYPVMVNNVLKKVEKIVTDKHRITIADCTFGFGGHSHRILQQFKNAKILAFQLDPQVLQHYQTHFQSKLTSEEQQRLEVIPANFTNLDEKSKHALYDIVLVDLGFNSFHLENGKGFTWLKQEDLDMRYSQAESKLSCKSIINRLSLLQLSDILRRYGQLNEHMQAAEAIYSRRPMLTTFQLRDAVVGCFQQDKTRKIAQVFQAFRIVTNNQLKNVEILCEKAGKALAKNGLFMGITFHSLQQNIIYNYVRTQRKKFSKVQTEKPSKQQIDINNKSHSAKLLWFTKL